MSEPLVTIRDLRYRYAGADEDVLRIPFLDLSGSGLIAITGPSGAGKTTLVELLAGTLHEPYEGSLEVLGKEWKDLRRDADRQRQLRRIGLIPQDFGLLPSWTPKRTLEQDLSDAEAPAKQRDMRVQASLAQVGLSDFAERDIGTLSGGQRQRVAIARMLARDVELVIADEPTANLDPDLVADIAGLLKELARKVPVIVVTHDPRMAEMCDRTIVLQAAVPAQVEFGEPGTGSPTSSRRGRRVLSVTVALLVAVALAGALFALNAAHSHRRGSAPGSGGALPASTPASTVVTATLPVHVLHTAWGITPAPSLLYPASVTVQLPRAWADKVAAYGVVGMVLLAPAGWTESNALIGADASQGARLHATGTSAIAGQLTYEGYWSGPALWAAAPYFPWVRAEWNQSGYSGSESPPAARSGLVEHLVGNQLAEYSLTSGPQVDDGLQVNGVAHMTAPGKTTGDFEFDRLEVVLPPSAHALGTAILNYYLSPDTSANQGVSSTLGTYFDAINSHDYGTAQQQFTPQQRHVTSVNHLATTTSTVHDSDIVIHDIRMIGSRKAVAFVTFTSTQDPSQGPNGDTQDNWTLDYSMKLVGWQWLIDDVGPHAGSTHKPA